MGGNVALLKITTSTQVCRRFLKWHCVNLDCTLMFYFS